MYGISRIDQPEKKNHGWYLRLRYDGARVAEFFADGTHGGKGRAKTAVMARRNECLQYLPEKRRAKIIRLIGAAAA